MKEIGSSSSSVRTREQTHIAEFWAYGPRTATPPGHWNQVAEAVARSMRNTPEENARMFALLNFAMAEAATVAWECKFRFNYWRPITAIHEADNDHNADTVGDRSWTPLLATPPFPEYVSGHSAFSGAAAIVLARFFGTDDVIFTVGSDDVPGSRVYLKFSDAAKESGLSRIYGGIHFMSGNLNGLAMGNMVGEFVFANALKAKGNRSRD